jgi:1-acyl-sn-glycerol-3-phosphate acyltransferase
VRSSLETLRGLESAGVVFEISGMDNVRAPSGPAVFIGNHMSTLETWVLPCLIQPWKDVTFVVKKSLVDYPVFGPVMRSRDPITVGRANPREDYAAVLEGGARRLEEGRSLIIFPQTTRSALFDPAQFNSMGVKLARRAGVPVVPVALKTDAWENGRRLKDFGKVVPSRPVHIRFGEPMAVSGTGAEQHARVVEFITASLAEWGAGAAGQTP